MGKAFSGFTTVILLQLIIGSIMMWGLGMIGLYISRIYDEVKGRPRYIIDQTINLDQNHREPLQNAPMKACKTDD